MSVWTEFKLVVTDPPKYSGHFNLIKNELVPFVGKNSLAFWITIYHNSASDYILFRVKCPLGKSTFIHDFLDDLKRKGLIVDWKHSSWDPAVDARSRIKNLSRLGFDPNVNIIVGCEGANLIIFPDPNIQERQEQLTALFEAVGECTKAIYSHLETKPKDLWIASLFIHLLLNSMDYSGPDATSEEDRIRKIPPV